ncbi:MAG: asparagine synthase-related protein [Parachlamydiales bacterium]|jgi:asparagine synthase (glutamine-hydrolysing)
MSGIAGVLYPDVFQVNNLVSPMLDTLGHRGKSPRDLYTFRNVQLGICGQKMAANAHKTIYCALDGSISNRKQILSDLVSLGIDPLTENTDAHLIIAAYETWGTEFLEQLNGDFAIALFDQKSELLLLARDRVGVKPLYWYHSHNTFIFGSELKALLATGAIPQTLAEDAISSYLYFGFIPQDLTPIQGVSKLLPGYTLIFKLDQSMSITPYWSLSAFFQNTHKDSPQQLVKQLDHLITDSIRIRLPGEGPIGSFVSGGIGSACTAYYLQKETKNQPLEIFTAGFVGHNDSDITAAREVAATLSIQQQVITISPKQMVDKLPSVVWYLDEPVADPNVIATWNLTKSASLFTKNVFSGMGSDEFLAGHSRYTAGEQQVSPWETYVSSLMTHSKKFIIPLLKLIWEPLAFSYLKQTRTDPWQFSYMQRNAAFDLKTLKAASPYLSKLFDPEVFLHKFHHMQRINNTVGALQYLDIKTRLVDCYIHQYERLSTAHGVTWQSPFLDRDLIEFAAGLPEPNNLEEINTASILKELLKHTFSKQLLNRPKRTRQNFLGDWAPLPPILELFHRLPYGSLVETGMISSTWLKERLKEVHSSAQVFRYLWSILMLELWVQIYVNRRIETGPPEQSAVELLKHSLQAKE